MSKKPGSRRFWAPISYKISIDNNVKNIVYQLETSEPILSELVEEGELTIVGACYHLDSGEVEILE
ncbi:MAG: carbonic anhydrase [Methanotrichaceae archaeon]|nr:carbonic anhydrase [Methanotrichaceae archaeon]